MCGNCSHRQQREVLSLAVKSLQISVDFVSQLQTACIYLADMLKPAEFELAL